ncbi:MAG: PAS domain S-box protein [Candidatus Hodarchaeota archaeon]
MPRKDEIKSMKMDERKEAEEKLKESEEKYRTLINNLTDIILEVDLKAIVTYVSPQCYDIMGYHPAELVGKSSLDYIYHEDVLKIAEAIKNAYKTKKMISVPLYRLLHKNGNVIFASANGKHFKTNGNDRFIVAIRDITAQIKIEKELKHSEEMHSLIAENANDLILIFNDKFQFEYANRKPLLNLLGYTVEEVIGKNGIEFVHPDDREKVIKPYKDGFEQDEGSVEARIKHKLGHYILIESNGKMFIDKEGKQKVLTISRDITERKNAERLIIDENKKLLEINQIKSELLTTTSHELKTPLNSVAAASQFLLNNLKGQIGEDALKFVEMIHRGGQKLKILIENLLDASNIEANKLNLHLQNENIVNIIGECIGDLQYWADKRDISIDYEHPKELNVLIDRIKIEQVITNLLSNAIKYTPPKGKIHIILDENDPWVKISIEDNGIGLTKKEMKSLFQKFGQIERYGKGVDVESEGSGLGLYISKEIVELHDGKILVESGGRNKGSTFIVKLPKP